MIYIFYIVSGSRTSVKSNCGIDTKPQRCYTENQFAKTILYTNPRGYIYIYMQIKKRLLALAFACMFALIIPSSALIVCICADHDCIGDGCPMCARIATVEQSPQKLMLLVKTLSIGALALVCLSAVFTLISERAVETGALVSLKVKLSDYDIILSNDLILRNGLRLYHSEV